MAPSSMEILASPSVGILLSGLIGRLSIALFFAFYLRIKFKWWWLNCLQRSPIMRELPSFQPTLRTNVILTPSLMFLLLTRGEVTTLWI
jgi:hypothetical protein